ncbi:MAG: AarF/UbiB family protein [Propioniciclava sp.]|uniref:ABC1 kinase family protein n=1 Tax=Propioniciclava sp. TaxID=2038686 RepID=UPI0039E6151B
MGIVESVLVGLVGVITTVLWVWALVVTARRVLGAPTGLLRTALIMGGVLVVSAPVLLAVARQANVLGPDGIIVDEGAAVIVTLAAFGLTFGIALTLLVISELVLPSRRDVVGFRSPFALGATVRQGVRSLRISTIFARHGAGRMVLTALGSASEAERRRTAVNLKLALEDCGATFVKFGQMLSTRPELLPAELIDELASLHADVAPEPYARLQRVLAEDADPRAFASFDEKPLAAASVGQVHPAVLTDGTEVVVKVQRPDARRQVSDDIAVLTRLSHQLAKASAWARGFGLGALVDGFSASLFEELDYRIEAGNALAIAARPSAASAGTIVIPKVYTELSSARVLVQERIYGVPVSSASGQLAALGDERRAQLADALLGEVLHQVLDTGLFHADIHPGNVLITDDRRLALLDFGSVGRLDSGSRSAITMLLFTLRSGDAAQATATLYDLLGRPDGVDDRTIERQLGALLLRVQSSTGDTSGLYSALTQFAFGNGFSIPPQVAAVFRTLSGLEGTLALISPGFNLLSAAETAGRGLIAAKLTRENLTDELTNRLVPLLPTLEQLPRRIDRLLSTVEEGRLEVGLRPFAAPADRAFIAGLVNQGLITVLAATSIVSGVLLLINGPGPILTANIGLFPTLGSTLLFIGLMLSLRVLAQIFVRRPE